MLCVFVICFYWHRKYELKDSLFNASFTWVKKVLYFNNITTVELYVFIGSVLWNNQIPHECKSPTYFVSRTLDID